MQLEYSVLVVCLLSTHLRSIFQSIKEALYAVNLDDIAWSH